MVDDFKNALSVGSSDSSVSGSGGYKVVKKNADERLSNLGVSLQWGSSNSSSGKSKDSSSSKTMKTHIVRGMALATVQYTGGVLPSLYSYNGLASTTGAIQIDGNGEDDSSSSSSSKTMECSSGKTSKGQPVRVEREMTLHFINSDFTWIVFFSRPVKARCTMSEGDEKLRDFQLDVVEYEQDDEEPLTVRVALLNQCTTGKSDVPKHCSKEQEWRDPKLYAELLRQGASVFPSNPQIDFEYPDLSSKSESDDAHITIDWGAQTTDKSQDGTEDLLMFALPHHQDSLSSASVTKECINTFHGSTCLVQGDSWKLAESVGKPMSFTAPRPPEPDAIPALAKALSDDIHYELSSNMLRAAADTYFSGKILARVARVVVIASEMKQLATSSTDQLKDLYYDSDDETLASSIEAAASANLPSDNEVQAALEQLRDGVQVWLSTKAEAPFVYDTSWGGLVNCGCRKSHVIVVVIFLCFSSSLISPLSLACSSKGYVGKGPDGYCNNTFPDCPALIDVNEDFGNGKRW